MRLNGTGELLNGHEYPATSGELIDAYGDVRIELQDGSESLGAVLARMGAETFSSPTEAYEALQSGVGHEAVGRRYYSDRDAPTVGEDGPDPVSF
ncbi:DUF5789 family protein [Halorarum salinum]|uniref:DUF2795 domain-containing protein n=1 Tax=Halorarum salinum TaxID=2743089 RepID=A0A7D5QIX4_9EURY|nr:DUF2795 domain-containing protein [Halobaculum salinum]QLG61005.1 DUF2795 domain-containing protein [Halobaculum salinum]